MGDDSVVQQGSADAMEGFPLHSDPTVIQT